MPHYKHSIPCPHPENADRKHTIVANTDCPRCGGSLDRVELEPGAAFHCPHCRGGLNVCARVEDGGTDRSQDVVTLSWLQPATFLVPTDAECRCGGCESRAKAEG